MELVACLSTGKGTWGHVSRLLEGGQFDKVFLITNDFGVEKFTKPDNGEFVVVNAREGMSDLVAAVKAGLEGKLSGDEVALNLTSGSGKEHMAILAALSQLGKKWKLMAVTKEGVKEV